MSESSFPIHPSERANREDIAARVRGDHPDCQSERRYVQGEVWLAHLRAKLHAEALLQAWDMIDNGVDLEDALASIGDAMDYVIPMPPEEKQR